MASTSITLHGITHIKASYRDGLGRSDFMRLTLTDRNGDEVEIELYAKSDVRNFEALAAAINAVQETRLETVS